MYLFEDDIYEETRKIKFGELEQSPLLRDLSNWIANELNIRVLNFRFDTVKIAKRNKFRLSIIVDNRTDYEKMVPDLFWTKNEEAENLIALKFKSLALNHDFPIDKRIKNIFVVFYDFSKEARSEANKKAVIGLDEKIKSKYPIVWKVYGVFDSFFVFYYLDKDVEENEKSGVSKTIRTMYYNAVKQFDEMNYFTSDNLTIKFDSKENLDKNFNGSLYNYIH